MGYSPQELADRAEIHDVIVRYGWAIDTKDWALLDTCFTDDAEVDYSSNPGGKKGPYRQIRSWLEKMISAFPITQHLMSNIDVQLSGDNPPAGARGIQFGSRFPCSSTGTTFSV